MVRRRLAAALVLASIVVLLFLSSIHDNLVRGGRDEGLNVHPSKRKGKDKRKRTFELFGKYTPRGLRHAVAAAENGKNKGNRFNDRDKALEGKKVR
mmetsp:Transcript_1500/g.2058  ORF Transcript_1500/g.2058 Transcript_1500/m.2058 type:complete len:96 (+) Transcript_1500:90-377(+)